MKYLKKTILFTLTISILCITFYSLYIPVCASEHGGSGGTNHGQLTEEEKRVKKLEIVDNIEKYLLFLCSEIGVYFSGSGYSDFYKNYVDYVKSTNDKWFENNVSVSDDGKAVFSETLLSSLKAYIDQYVKTEQVKEENGGFYLLPTTKYIDVPATSFPNSFQYQTFRNIVLEKGLLAYKINSFSFVDLFSDPEHPKQLYFTLPSTPDGYLKNPNSVVYASFMCAYDWVLEKGIHPVMIFPEENKIYKSCSEAKQYSTESKGYIDTVEVNGYDNINYVLYSTTGERVRVFVSKNAAKNYSVGSRKVFVTQNYYDYEPADLTVSIDDLQKSVDDLQKIIDELLKRVTDKTSEKEIMELLRLILEELRNQQGTGGGSGSGDVTVSLDLTTTNNWLSKIYDKVSQIFDKVSSSAGQSMSEVVESIENLEKMLKKYLSEITGDLDDIKGQLAEMSEQEFSEKTDSFLDDSMESFSEIGEVAKTKFPFSIPNDLRILISKMAPPEAEAALYSVDTSGMSLYSDGEHGGGGAFRDDDDANDDKGGGGASRPSSSGFVSVEHGGGGGSRGSAEMKDGAPVFYLPIVIERYGIEEYIIVNMAPFEPVSKLSRTLFAIMFMLCLFNLTFKTMGLWGDLVG